MTAPKQARPPKAYDGPRQYDWPPAPPGREVNPFPEFTVISVTSATDNYPKPWLTGWAVKMTAERAVDKYEWLGQKLKNEGEKDALKWLKAARYDSAGVKADRGTVVHLAVEAYLAGKPLTRDELNDQLKERRVPEEMWKGSAAMLAGVMEFLFDEEPEILWSESTVYSREHRYAGTADMIAKMRVRGTIQPVILDIKTSKDIYDDVCLQLCGYGRADFVGVNEGTEHEPKWVEAPLIEGLDGPIRHGVVINPKANGTYKRGDFDLDDDVFRTFLACLELANAQVNNVVSKSRRS